MNIFEYETIDSTNTEAKRLLGRNLITGPSVIFAHEQTQGKGRYGRHWHSPRGNFYATFVIEHTSVAQDIAMMSAVYVGMALNTEVQFKWPNDILLNHKKVAGVLIEREEPYWLIGVGVNLISSPILAEYATTYLNTGLSKENLLNKLIGFYTDPELSQEQILAFWHQHLYIK